MSSAGARERFEAAESVLPVVGAVDTRSPACPDRPVLTRARMTARGAASEPLAASRRRSAGRHSFTSNDSPVRTNDEATSCRRAFPQAIRGKGVGGRHPDLPPNCGGGPYLLSSSPAIQYER
jgi:hypothetical protein